MNRIAVEEFPGYFYNYVWALQQWLIRWEPLEDAYSPPILDHSARWFHLSPPQGVNLAPLNNKKIAQEINAIYVYYRHDINKLEIWAHDIAAATTNASIYLQGVRQRHQHPQKKLIPPLR